MLHLPAAKHGSGNDNMHASSNVRKSISAMASGFAIAASIAGTDAKAANVNTLTVASATPLGPNTCDVRGSFSVTGATNDSAGFDYFMFGHVTGGGLRYNAPAQRAIGVGQTDVSSGAGASIGISGLHPDTYYYVIYEATIVSGLITQGAELARAPIPRSLLAAAGGACAGLVINAAPVVNAGPNQNLAGGGVHVTLAGTSSDGDGDTLTHSWTQVGGPSVSLTGANTLTPSFTAPVQTNHAQTLTFRLSTTDGIVAAPVVDEVSITIPAGPNTLPVANAGPDATAPAGSTVTLAGNASDIDGDPLSFVWSQQSGPVVTLANAASATASFTAPARTASAQTLVFNLVANDGFGNSAPDAVTVTIPANMAPTANAGADLTRTAGSAVVLAGSATDPENDALTYQWTQTAGSSVTLSGATTLTPGFTAPPKTASAQTLRFSLVANDGDAASAADTVDVTIPANLAPTANAGSSIVVAGGAQASLNGGGSTDADGDTLSYQWVQTSGPAVTLGGASTATPSFTAPARQASPQTLEFALTVSDGIATSAPASVTVTIPSNSAPVADAGSDANAAGGSQVTLQGSATDPESDAMSYQWSQTSGPAVALSGAATLSPVFTAPAKTAAAQTLTFRLVASDGVTSSNPDEVTITVPANGTPVANAGTDTTVAGGGAVILDGTGSSDADGDALGYNWVQTGGPSVTLANSTSAHPSFTAPAATGTAQTLTFALTVGDGLSTSPADTVTITVDANRAPVADAGADQGPVNTGQTVSLNGSASSDPDGNPLTYRWTQLSGPAAILSNANSATPTFVAPTVNGTQNLVFQLVVNDGVADSPPDTVTIAVRAVGTVTVIQKVVGADGSFSFTSDITALSGTVATTAGTGQRSATLVPAGAHTLAAGDARNAGYAVTSISCNDTDSVINLASRSVAIALSPNENLVCTFTSTNTRDAALSAISNFLTARNAALLAHQPALQRRLDRLSGSAISGGSAMAHGVPVPAAGRLPLSLTIAGGTAQASSSLGMARAAAGAHDGAAPFDVWIEASFGSLDYAGNKGRFSVVYTGADYRIGRNLLIGALAQIDRYTPSGTLRAGAVAGHGWMAGPYVTARLAPNLYADVRAAWGGSDNTVSPLGTYVDPFQTTRGLYSAALIGQFNIGSSTQLRPELAVRQIDEHQRSYTDALGVPIPAQTVRQGDIAFRPRIQHSIALRGYWTLRPYLGADGIYTYGLERQSVFADQFRMRVEGGADISSPTNLRASLSAFQDGIGSSGYKSAGVQLSFSIGF